ncbi:MAG: murein biosynthesis integral membrane protein MurJ [Helicobacter trogontum]|uniref:murein biosynthesis integral membrane protein MurJ n=1 Tax=Helicobacter trogontum TaxID=50960 RepID=UPI00242F64E0|nr:murein biosynthesis integral membrane protein MurJ [Helicobacter trogontum]MCI5787536.1 murein biosynthesis integral membrane protein MurJ [Helicobacter trogontum]
MLEKHSRDIDTKMKNNKKQQNIKKNHTKTNKLKRFFLTNASGILCSRIFGFLRDAMQAAVLGTSIYSDIFFIAFKFPNMFRRVVSEGAFVQSFLPFFLSTKKKGAFSVSIFWIFIFFILILSMLVMWFTPFITKVLALGYDEDRIALAMPLVRIHFWYLILIFIVTYLSTLLQYKNIFWVNAYNTALLNIAMIVAMLPYQFQTTLTDKELFQAVYVLSYAVLIGGICQIVVHFYPLYKAGLWRLQYVGILALKKWCKDSHISISPKGISFKMINNESKNPHPNTSIHNHIVYPLAFFVKAKYNILRLLIDIKAFFKAFFPAMLGASTAQIIAIIDSSLITLLPNSDGGVSTLNFANRIFQLPLAIFAIAISSALFPTIAKAIERKDEKMALWNLKTAFWFLLITLSVCTLGGIMLSNEIVWLLFERKNFTREDTLQVAWAFIGYMAGLLTFGLTRIFSLWLYAKKQQARAAKYSVIALAVGTLLSAIFIFSMRYLNITDGILWDLRYFLVALAGSIGGLVLLVFNIKAFGIHNFLVIIQHKKYTLYLLIALGVTFIVLQVFKHFFYIA